MKPSILSYLLFFIIGAFPNLFGVLVLGMASDFSVTDVRIGYMFTWFTVSNTISIFAVPIILNKFKIRYMLYISSFFDVIGIALLTFSMNLYVFALGAFLLGIGLGAQFSLGNVILVRHYDLEARSSRLNFMHFFFSAGAFLAPYFSSRLLAMDYSWRIIYRLPFIFLIPIIVIVFFIKFNENVEEDKNESNISFNLSIFLIGLAMFSYIISELGIANWVVVYLNKVHNLHVKEGSNILSLFWISIAIGRILTGIFINKIKLQHYLVLFSLGASISLLLFVFSSNYSSFIICILMTGIFFSGIYASIFSFGTSILEKPSGKIISFYLTCGGIGYVVFFIMSGMVIEHFGIEAVLYESLIFMTIITVLILTVSSMQKKNNH